MNTMKILQGRNICIQGEKKERKYRNYTHEQKMLEGTYIG